MGVTSITDRPMTNVLLCGFVISCVSVFSASEWATPQEPEAAKQTVPTPRIPSTGFAGLDNYRASRIAMFTDDFGQLARYRSANDTLATGAPAKGRVVFFGDSITDIWKLENYFAGRAYVNRGIGGQTTPQMLVRFRQDVIDLSPKSVVILA